MMYAYALLTEKSQRIPAAIKLARTLVEEALAKAGELVAEWEERWTMTEPFTDEDGVFHEPVRVYRIEAVGVDTVFVNGS